MQVALTLAGKSLTSTGWMPTTVTMRPRSRRGRTDFSAEFQRYRREDAGCVRNDR